MTDQRTVGEIAAEYPASARVFEKYQIDFCCGGKVPLEDACRARGVDPRQLREELAQATQANGAGAPDWTQASLSDLIRHITGTHHEYLKSELPRLSALLAKVQNAHGAKHGEMLTELGGVYDGLREELDAHLMKEEMVLFPLIQRIENGQAGAAASHCGSVNNPIRVMMHEHDSAGDALARMRQITSGYTLPDGACNTFRALWFEFQEMERDLHQHIHLENNILFPRAARLEAGE